MPVLLVPVFAAALSLSPQQPAVQNGRVETRAGTSIDKEMAAVGASPDPVWIGWRVPMIDGDRNLCSSWSDGRTYVRGEFLESRPPGPEPAQIAAPTGPVRLESGTQLLVLARMIDGRLERIRVLGDDCPIDAGNRTLYWLTGVTPAESVRYLEGLTRLDALSVSSNRRLAEAAASAIAYHRDAAATAALDRLSARDADRSLRRQAATALASGRGQHGFDRVMAMIKEERDRELRQNFVTALGESPQTAAIDALLGLARTDPDPGVRGEAAYRYVRRAGQPGLTTARGLLDNDADDNVKRRVVSGIASLPSATSAPVLIDLARNNKSLVVRKEAVSALGRSKDPAALAFLEELVGK